MTHEIMQRIFLDDLLINQTDSEINEDIWLQLLSDPNRVEAWKNAVNRRNWLDQITKISVNKPEILTFLKISQQRPARLPNLHHPNYNIGEVFGDMSKSIDFQIIPWGQKTVVRVTVGKQCFIKCNSDESVWYSYQNGTGLLEPHDGYCAWKMELGESPILLAILQGSSDITNFESAIVSSSDVAWLLLIEEENP